MRIKSEVPSNQNIKSAIVAFIVLVILVASTTSFTRFKIGQWEKDIRSQMLDYMTGKKSNLEKSLYSRIYYTRGVAAYVSLNPDITNEEYAELAKEYIRSDTVINSMALSKDCILNAIYPYVGHEEAIGLNLMEHPERRAIVEKTIETHKTFVAGPVELVEGGIAFISYTPIFDKTASSEEKFWGITDIVIKQNELLNESGIKFNDNGYNFSLRGYDGTGEEGAVFWGDESIFGNDPVKVNIDLPNGNWVLAAIPENGWKQYADQDKTLFLVLIVSSFLISILIWLFSRALMQIRQNEKELKAIFASLDSLIIEFNKEGKYLKVASENRELLYLPAEKIIGKNLSEIFDKEKSEFFKNAIRECIAEKKLVVIEYPLEIKGIEHWFSARISYKSENSIIFNAYDITESKNREKQLQKLNETKDKFFSVIAHDLRGPLGSQKGIVDLILEQYNDLDELTRKSLLINLQESSYHIHSLLENLLKWSMSQTGRIDVNLQKINFNEQFSGLFDYFKIQTEIKKIKFINRLESDLIVNVDVNLTEVILRNLLSNAIKYTNQGGEINLFSEVKKNETGKTINISISDTGVGIPKERIDKLFRIGENYSNPGTDGEKGSGLGLLLCKEFAELQGGSIKIESTVEKGSTFSFVIPLK